MIPSRRVALYLGAIILLALLVGFWYNIAIQQSRQLASLHFDGARALRDVEAQVAFGPRIPSSNGHARALQWMQTELQSAGWQVQVQSATSMSHPIQNLIAFRTAQPPQILLGAHYDSRVYANRDPDPGKRLQPVPGADDGASGVAILIELARTLPRDSVPMWLVFFDAEDNGEIPGWDWLLGSRSFVANMTVRPKSMVLVDMVGGEGLRLPLEFNSDPGLRASIWATAARLGFGTVFIPQVKYQIEDDHVPFIEAGIPAVDIIGLDYAYWHTTSDVPQHVSARSLQIVGDVLWTWLGDQTVPPK